MTTKPNDWPERGLYNITAFRLGVSEPYVLALEERYRIALEALRDLDANYDFHPKAQQTISDALSQCPPLPETKT